MKKNPIFKIPHPHPGHYPQKWETGSLFFSTRNVIVMKLNVLALLMAASSCYAQDWEAEIMIGIAGYQGDLTKRHFALRTLRPATNVNIKYNIGNVVVLRTGIVIGKVTGNDKYNKQADLKARNLNFQSNIFEANICAEVNLLEPDIFYAYPYAFAGVGIFHFNPFSHG